jgi:hypothetical protein
MCLRSSRAANAHQLLSSCQQPLADCIFECYKVSGPYGGEYETTAIALMKAESSSERSVNFYETTRRNIPEDCHMLIFSYITRVERWFQFTTPG